MNYRLILKFLLNYNNIKQKKILKNYAVEAIIDIVHRWENLRGY